MEKLRIFASTSSLLILLIFAIFLSGCYATNVQAPPPQPCEINSAQNIYKNDNSSSKTKGIVEKIYSWAPINIQVAQREAFRFLRYQTKRWTQVEDRAPNNEPSIRTIVTFISPDLVRAVILNHILFNFKPDEEKNWDSIRNNIDRLADNNELVFFMILQPEPMESKTFTIASQNIRLTNTLATMPGINIVRSDSILNQSLIFTEKPYSGYFYYPIAIKKDDECVPSINTEKDTNITLSTNQAIIGNTQNISINWSFCFCSLLVMDDIIYEPSPDSIAPGELFVKPEPQSKLPPYNFYIEDDEDKFYEILAQFIWAKMTSEEAP